jgi:[CysO sulfur-carrier protein]-thiocarboxylate-dependent cysteine synthase
VKDRIAKFMIEPRSARASAEARPDDPRADERQHRHRARHDRELRGYPVKVVMPDAVSPERIQLLQAFGAEIIYSPGALGTNGSVKMATRSRDEHPDWFMPFQYENEMNPRAHYETTAPEIIADLPDLDVFIAGLGTGGTLTGVGRRLKEYNPRSASSPRRRTRATSCRGCVPSRMATSHRSSTTPCWTGGSWWTRRARSRRRRNSRRRPASSPGSPRAPWCVPRSATAERMEAGKIVVLLADGGWKYLSTGLWGQDYEDIREAVSEKLWW